MNKKDRLEILSKRVTKLEKKLHIKNEELTPTNEVAPIVAKIIQIIIKNLPLILKVLPQLVNALKTDQVNDNEEKIDKLSKFTELGNEIVQMFSNDESK